MSHAARGEFPTDSPRSSRGGGLAQALQGRGFTPFESYRVVVVGYAVIGAAMVLLFLGLSSSVEPPRAMRVTDKPAWFEPDLGLRASKRNVFKLAGLFTVDAFAGDFVVQGGVQEGTDSFLSRRSSS
jgi:hypothetical protein